MTVQALASTDSDLISSNNIQHCSRKIQWPSCSACQHRTHFCPGALLFASSLSSGVCSNRSPFERAPPSPAYLSSNNFHFCFSLHIFFFFLILIIMSRECMLLGSLSRHNKNLEWRTLKPLGGSQLSEDRPFYSSPVSNGPCYSS